MTRFGHGTLPGGDAANGGGAASDVSPGDSPTEEQVLAELLAARKRPGGLSVASMATCPVMTGLLGAGDPAVALKALEHHLTHTIKEYDDTKALQAVAYSLGLASAADTHLRRLDEFGALYHLEQRQVRRYADEGARQLARLVTTQWVSPQVPSVDVYLMQAAARKVALSVTTTRFWFIDMDPIQVLIATGPGQFAGAGMTFAEHRDDSQVVQEATTPGLFDVDGTLDLRIVWAGETWPRYTFALHGGVQGLNVMTHTVGDRVDVQVKVAEVTSGDARRT